MKKDNLKQQYRINEQIRVREVRIVGDDVESTVMPTAKALQMAEAQGVDSWKSPRMQFLLFVV